ncbi:hypothetical protein F4777DRAFT_553044 [Nemania sp. FL0916]|nr:hypothetical protein F4777DRAFT_553044 [Nemania sp. FL0916]
MDQLSGHLHPTLASDVELERMSTTDGISIDLPSQHQSGPDTPTVTSDLGDLDTAYLRDEQVGEELEPAASSSIDSSAPKKPTWLPYTLRRIPQCLILTFSLLLELAVLIAHVISLRNSGLVEDNGSRAIVVGSKFVPTLLAVAFGLLATILLDDVKRTEPFSRMASPSGATGKESLTWVAGAWWTIPSPVGKGNLPLFCATLIFMLSPLAMSPLSSTLFVTQTVVLNNKTSFHQLDLDSLVPIQPIPQATTYFRTISNILQNVSTTAWISDNYFVLPFWPGSPSNIPLSPILSDVAQTWSARTTVFSIDLECDPMQPRWENLPILNQTKSTNISVTVASESGCSVDLKLGNSSVYRTGGGNIWSSVDDISSILEYFFAFDGVEIHGCSENEIFISWTEGVPPFNNFSVGGQACQYTYYIGNSSTTVTMGQGQSTIAINETEYHLSKMPLAATIANTAAIDKVFFNLNWTLHLDSFQRSNSITQRQSNTGPANLLSALYRISQARLLADESVIESLRRIRKRFFAELFHSAFELEAVENAVSIPGTVTTSSRRVVAVSAVANALEVVLLIQSILIATVLYTTRPSKRPLGLTEDPSSVVGVARLISHDPSVVETFAKCPNTATDNLDQSPATAHFILIEDKIEALEISALDSRSCQHRPPNPSRSKLSIGRPAEKQKKATLFRTWLLGLLFVLLSLTLATIANLYQRSQTRGLYETIFVYNIGVSIGGENLGTVNPASIFTTLVAVIIGLWWGTYDTTLRKIQPYLALAQSPVPGHRGIAVSYKSSYLLWAAYRAARRSHWILLLVSTGAFLVQILTITMSSLWNRELGDMTTFIRIPKVLELRNVPMVFEVLSNPWGWHPADYRGQILQSLFTNRSTSWMYGATIQSTLHGPDPPWSMDGWSFVLNSLTDIASQSIQDTGNSTELAALSVNVTIESPAIRGRLECSPYNFLHDQTRWLTEWDLTNDTNWNTTVNPNDPKVGFELGTLDDSWVQPRGFYLGEGHLGDPWTSFFVNKQRLQCCENKTSEFIGVASIGYWSPNWPPNSSRSYPQISYAWPNNFTIKWIHGRPTERILEAERPSIEAVKRLIWVEPPQMMALNCQPMIETANTQVTLDYDSKRVLSYKILDIPRAYEQAWDSPWIEDNANLSAPGSHARNINVSVSHGVLFMTALLGAADVGNFGGNSAFKYNTDGMEDTSDQMFNFRQSGLNVDYMTYAMLSSVDFDHQQLLDAAILERTAQRTFSIMYQHFVNNELSLATGGYAYQRFGEKFSDSFRQRVPGSKREAKPANTTNSEYVMLQVSRPVEILNISKPAAWICLAILAYLIVTCGTLAIVSRQYTRMVPKLIDSIADTAVLVAGSVKLLELAKLKSTREIKKDSHVRAKLGWFNDTKGQKRWGVELVPQ